MNQHKVHFLYVSGHIGWHDENMVGIGSDQSILTGERNSHGAARLRRFQPADDIRRFSARCKRKRDVTFLRECLDLALEYRLVTEVVADAGDRARISAWLELPPLPKQRTLPPADNEATSARPAASATGASVSRLAATISP
jgi:hypothetical protein